MAKRLKNQFNDAAFGKKVASLTAAPGSITTPRLTIQRITACSPAQIESFTRADSWAFTREIWDYRPEPDISIAELVDNLRDGFVRQEQKHSYWLAIMKEDRIIGILQTRLDEECHLRLSYYISPSERQQGYASEAYRGFLTRYAPLAPDEMLYATIVPENKISQAFLRKLGFAAEGLVEATVSPHQGQMVFAFHKPVRDFIPPAPSARPQGPG